MESLVTILVYGIIAVLLLFILTGVVTLVAGLRQGRALRRAEREGTAAAPAPAGTPAALGTAAAPRGPSGIRGALHRYVGPVEPRHALLNPPARVGIEAFGGLFGFPGLGWLISGKVVTGLVLLVLGPSFIWGFFPVYLIATEKMADHPYLFIEYLPAVSVMSATLLAVYQVRLARGRAEKQLEAPQ